MLERACGYWSSCCPKRMSFSPRCVLCTRMKNCVKSGFSFYLPSFCFHYIVPSERGKCTAVHDCCGAKSHVRLTWSTVCMCVSSKLYNRSKNWIRKKLIKIEFFSLPEVNPLKQSALYTCKCSVPHRINRHAIYTLQAFSFLLCLSLFLREQECICCARSMITIGHRFSDYPKTVPFSRFALTNRHVSVASTYIWIDLSFRESSACMCTIDRVCVCAIFRAQIKSWSWLVCIVCVCLFVVRALAWAVDFQNLFIPNRLNFH